MIEINEELHNNNAFAMLHDASAIDATPWVGMRAIDSFTYLSGLMNLADPLFDLGLSAKHLALVRNAFDDLIEFQKLFTSFPATEDGIVVNYQQCVALLNARADIKNGIAYMPSGWTGLPGHFVAVKLQRVERNIFCVSYLQQGAGIQYHQPMCKGEYKTKYCYQSDPMLIDFDTELGQNFLLGTVTLNYDKRILFAVNQVKGYDADDLYGLLRVTGTPLTKFIPDSRQAVTPQRVGSCALTNAKLVANDVLIFLCGYSAKKIKRYTFGLKANSLQVAIDAYARGKCDEKLLIWALREADVRINKHYPEIITVNECLITTQLVQSVKIERSVVDLVLPELSEQIKMEPMVPVVQAIDLNDNNNLKKSRKKARVQTIIVQQLPPAILPQEVAAAVAQAIENLKSNKGLAYRLELLKFLRSLPKTSGLPVDEFWDQVPLDQQFQILDQLFNKCKSFYKGSELDVYALEASLIIYDIAAQLAIRNPELDFQDRYAPGFSDVIPATLRFCEPEIYYNVKSIVLNFHNRCQGKRLVFTNDIVDWSYDDKTVLYLREIFLTPERRRILIEKLIKKGVLKPGVNIEELPDNMLIKAMLTGSHIKGRFNFNKKQFQGKFYWLLLRISALAHRLGRAGLWDAYELNYNFSITADFKFIFNELSRFSTDLSAFYQMKNFSNSRYSIVLKHFPQVANTLQTGFNDIAENLTAHPLRELRHLNNGQKYKDSALYQYCYGGTFHFGASVWPKAVNDLRLESLDEEFRRIEATGKMSIIVLLEWLFTHLGELELPVVRQRISEIVFSFGHLDYVLTTHTAETLRLINEFLQVAIYQSIEISSQIFQYLCDFKLRLSQYIRIAANLYHINIQNFSMVDLCPVLILNLNRCKDIALKKTYAALLLSSFSDKLPESRDDFYCLLRAKLFIHLNANEAELCENDKVPSLEALAYQVWQMHLPALMRRLAELSEVELSEFMEEVLESISPPLKKSRWVIDYPIIKCINKILKISLITGYVYINTQRIYDRNAEFLQSSLVKYLPINPDTAKFYDIPSSKKHTEDLIVSADGIWEFIRTQDTFHVRMKLKIDGVESVYTLISKGQGMSDAIVIAEVFAQYELRNPFSQEFIYFKAPGQLVLLSRTVLNQGYLYTRESGWQLLIRNPNDTWSTTGHRRLDFHTPKLALEHTWKATLAESIGFASLTAIAQMLDNATLVMESFTWSAFNLSFKNRHGSLLCDQHPGYFWRQLKRHTSLRDLTTLIILENEQGEYKYLIPPFQLIEVDQNDKYKNKALSSDNFINYDKTLAFPDCFEYELDRYGELAGTTADANLYLAILYRCLGDYRPAMLALKRSESLVCNTELQLAIASLTMSWPDCSALGSAFDCQLMMRLYHHAFKWSKEQDHALSQGKKLIQYCYDQFMWYRLNYSTRKKGICIIPEYLRLTQNQLALFGVIESTLKEKQNRQSLYSNGYLQHLYPEEKLNKLNELFQYKVWSSSFEHEFNLVSLSLSRYCKQAQPSAFAIRVYQKENLKDPDALGFPGYEHLLRHFANYVDDALSTDDHIEKQLLAQLFMLAKNDNNNEKSQRLIFLLIVVMQNRSVFKSLGHPLRTKDCIYDILVKGTQHRVGSHHPIIPLQFKQVSLATLTSAEDALITALKCQFRLSSYQEKPIHQYPYRVLAKKYLVEAKSPVATNSIMDSIRPGRSKIEYRLMAHFHKGNEINKTQQKTLYEWLNENLTLDDLRHELARSCLNDQRLLRELADEMLSVANAAHAFKTTAEEAYFQSAHHGEQRNLIGIPELFRALLNQDHSDLLKMNPFLKQEHCDYLMSCIIEYALIQIRIDQALSIIKLKLHELQKIAKLLSAERHYSVVDYPEFLVYEYATKRLLRHDQVECLVELIKLIEADAQNVQIIRHALLQFAAGGGKTAVIIPILVQRFATKGFLVVIVNTNEMYSIAIHEIPKNLQFAFQIFVEVIERELEHQWTYEELTRLHQDLTRWIADRKCLLIKPITWHSIHIAAAMGYEQKNLQLAQAAEKVLDFFSERSVMLDDEAHVNNDPLQQSIKTHGERLTVAIEQQQLIVDIYEHLLGIAPDSQVIAELAGIIHKSKKLLSEEELVNLQMMLVDRMITFEVFRTHDHADIKQYFLQADKTKPQWLRDLRVAQPSQASLVVLGRAFIKTLLPHLLTLQYNTDFGVSIHPGDLTAAPMLEGKHEKSHFADQMKVLSLTIQLYFITGIPADQLSALLMLFKQQHLKQSQYIKVGLTPAEQLLNSILPKGVGYVSLSKLSDLRKRSIISNPAVCNSFAMIKEFLFKIVFQQISTPKRRVESTAADFQAGFRRRISFSATPGLRELYYPTLTKEHYHEMLSFEAEVLATMLRSKNSDACMIEMTHDPHDFFQQIKNNYPEFFARMQSLFDRGALVSDLEPAVVTAALMELFTERDGRDAILHFEQGDMVITAKQAPLNAARASGTNIAALLKRYDIKPESLLLFLFLDLSKTTGTDVVRPINDCAAVTIGKGQTLSGTIQASMRARQLLEENAQTLCWILFKDLYAKISPDEPQFDLYAICFWMIANDAVELENKIINRAYQVINQVLTAEAKKLIRKNPKHYEKIRNVLHQEQALDPYLLYEIESVQESPKKVLDDYTARLWKDLHLGRFHRLPPSSVVLLQNLVQETDDLVFLMTTPHGAELNAQVVQEQMQVVQQLQEIEFNNLLDLGHDFIFKMEGYHDKFDSLPKLFGYGSLYAPMRFKILGVKQPITYPKILINLAHFQPYSFIRESTYLTYLKPLQALLVARLKHNGPLHIIGCTSAGIQYFAQQILQVNANDKACYALIGKNGHVLCASRNMDIEMKQDFERDENLREAIIFSALLDGEVKELDQLVSLVQKYRWSEQDFNALVNTITSLHVSRSMVMLQDIPGFAERCGWKAAKAPVPLNNLPKPAAESRFVLKDCPLTPVPPSPRWSAARLFYTPRSVLSGVLFGEGPTSLIDLPVIPEPPK